MNEKEFRSSNNAVDLDNNAVDAVDLEDCRAITCVFVRRSKSKNKLGKERLFIYNNSSGFPRTEI